MYTEVVQFRFSDNVAPSERLKFLAQLAGACEGNPMRIPNHYYFAISTGRNTGCRVDFMMPSAFQIGTAQLRTAQRQGLLTVTKPEGFAPTLNEAGHGDA